MIDPKIKEELEQLSKTTFGKALKVYLEEKKAEIGDITACKNWEDTQGRQHALKLINDLFTVMEPVKLEKTRTNQYT